MSSYVLLSLERISTLVIQKTYHQKHSFSHINCQLPKKRDLKDPQFKQKVRTNKSSSSMTYILFIFYNLKILSFTILDRVKSSIFIIGLLFGFVFFYIDMMTVPVFLLLTLKLREKYPYPEFFWSVFSRIGTEYGEILLISPYSIQIWKNTDQKNSEYTRFLRCVKILCVAMKRSNSIYCWANKRFFHIFHQ